jgi:lysophospholipase L1-like esterase
LSQFLEKNHINCLDMLPEFKNQGRSTALYRVNDTHWNEAGNKLAAEMILSFLRQHRMVPVN